MGSDNNDQVQVPQHVADLLNLKDPERGSLSECHVSAGNTEARGDQNARGWRISV